MEVWNIAIIGVFGAAGSVGSDGSAAAVKLRNMEVLKIVWNIGVFGVDETIKYLKHNNIWWLEILKLIYKILEVLKEVIWVINCLNLYRFIIPSETAI